MKGKAKKTEVHVVALKREEKFQANRGEKGKKGSKGVKKEADKKETQ